MRVNVGNRAAAGNKNVALLSLQCRKKLPVSDLYQAVQAVLTAIRCKCNIGQLVRAFEGETRQLPAYSPMILTYLVFGVGLAQRGDRGNGALGQVAQGVTARLVWLIGVYKKMRYLMQDKGSKLEVEIATGKNPRKGISARGETERFPRKILFEIAGAGGVRV